MKPEINGIYLIQENYASSFDEDYYETLVPMVHTHTTCRMDDGTRYYFECPITNASTSVDSWSLKSNVFDDEQDFLVYSVGESLRLNKPMDDFFIDLVNKSKEEFPEKWI